MEVAQLVSNGMRCTHDTSSRAIICQSPVPPVRIDIQYYRPASSMGSLRDSEEELVFDIPSYTQPSRPLRPIAHDAELSEGSTEDANENLAQHASARRSLAAADMALLVLDTGDESRQGHRGGPRDGLDMADLWSVRQGGRVFIGHDDVEVGLMEDREQQDAVPGWNENDAWDLASHASSRGSARSADYDMDPQTCSACFVPMPSLQPAVRDGLERGVMPRITADVLFQENRASLFDLGDLESARQESRVFSGFEDVEIGLMDDRQEQDAVPGWMENDAWDMASHSSHGSRHDASHPAAPALPLGAAVAQRRKLQLEESNRDRREREIRDVARRQNLLHTLSCEQGEITMVGMWSDMLADAARQESLERELGAILDNTVPSRRRHIPALADFDSSRLVMNMTPSAYISRILRYAQASPCCLVLGVVYLQRLNRRVPSACLTFFNMQRLLLTLVMIASKMMDDRFCKNLQWAHIGNVDLRELNKLELSLLTLLDFHLCVKREEYEEVKASLREVDMNTAHFLFSAQALTQVSAPPPVPGLQADSVITSTFSCCVDSLNRSLQQRRAADTAAAVNSRRLDQEQVPSDKPYPASPDEAEGLPAGWKALVSRKTGRTYYGNIDSGASTWQRPVAQPREAQDDKSPQMQAYERRGVVLQQTTQATTSQNAVGVSLRATGGITSSMSGPQMQKIPWQQQLTPPPQLQQRQPSQHHLQPAPELLPQPRQLLLHQQPAATPTNAGARYSKDQRLMGSLNKAVTAQARRVTLNLAGPVGETGRNVSAFSSLLSGVCCSSQACMPVFLSCTWTRYAGAALAI